MNKLDDLLAKKKLVAPVLDLSKNLPQTKEELKRLMEKVPDYKMRPIRVRGEEIKTKEKDYSFKPSRKETKKLMKNNGERDLLYIYSDPIPVEMRAIVLKDLCAVLIDWKMLTTLRPKTKVEEEYFSKLVEMGKLQLKAEIRYKKEYQLNTGVRKFKNKSGIIENRLIACLECGEEFCNGRTCLDFNYDLYVRLEDKSLQQKLPAKAPNTKGASLKNKSKRKIKKRNLSRSPTKKEKEN